jgi:two-component system response regulator PilR (NtrC family)
MTTSAQVLIIDDEPDIRELLEITLSRMNISTHSADSLQSAKQCLLQQAYQLCLTDLHLPDGNGLDLVSHIQNQFPQLPVAVITAFGSMDTAISAMKAGAFDYISKPVDLTQLRELVSNALKLREPQQTANEMIGDSSIMQQLNQTIRKLARSQAPIYIHGESGTGKELVARLIHRQGPRHDAPFVPVNCGAIPSELMESEFFGHKKGSFTGANEDKIGLFQAAHGGTLFLDEVADLPLAMQVKLLRAIQEKKVRPVGAQKEISVDVRILCATHQDLYQQVNQQRFRQDLYYRLNVIQLNVPALRERANDIPLIANHILQRLTAQAQPSPITNQAPIQLSSQAQQALQTYHFEGNVRELENILERAMTLCDGNLIEVEHLQLNRIPSNSSSENSAQASLLPASDSIPERGEQPLEDYLMAIEKSIILKTLNATNWNRTLAAKQLGMTLRAMRYRLQKLNLSSDQDDEAEGDIE